MTRWPDLPVLGSAELPRLSGGTGETVDILAPAGLKPKRDLTTTPPGQTIEVYGGQSALQHRRLIEVHYDGQSTTVPVPDLPRALSMKCIAYDQEHKNRPARAFKSRHLDDIAFLASLIEDPDEMLTELNPEHLAMASVLDNRGHHAWAAVTNPAVAHLVWETLRDS